MKAYDKESIDCLSDIFYAWMGGFPSEQAEVQKFLQTSGLDQLISEKDLTEAAIKGMMGLLGDKYSFYMDTETTDDFNEKLDGKFTGLGVEIILGEENIPTISNVFGE